MIGQGCLGHVLRLLIVAPVFLPLSFFSSHLLVFSDNLSMMTGVTMSLLIFKHSTHPINGLLLSSPISFILLLSLGSLHILTSLLVGPVLLVLAIQLHSLVVHEILALKLSTAGRVLRLSLSKSVSSLLRALHFTFCKLI